MNKRATIGGGIVLILLGLLFLARAIFRDVFGFMDWPFIIVGVGMIFLLFAIFTKTGGLAVPGCIISGVGGILYYQSTFNAWHEWYLWMLVPAFVGVGVIVSSLIDGSFRKDWIGGVTLLFIGAALFCIFGGVFGYGLAREWAQYWPVLLIVWGALVLLRTFLRRGDKPKQDDLD